MLVVVVVIWLRSWLDSTKGAKWWPLILCRNWLNVSHSLLLQQQFLFLCASFCHRNPFYHLSSSSSSFSSSSTTAPTVSKKNTNVKDSDLLESGRVVYSVSDGWEGKKNEGPYDAIHVGQFFLLHALPLATNSITLHPSFILLYPPISHSIHLCSPYLSLFLLTTFILNTCTSRCSRRYDSG